MRPVRFRRRRIGSVFRYRRASSVTTIERARLDADDIFSKRQTSPRDRESCMRWLLIVLAVLGIVVSSLALREHYRTDASPCSINEKWDCGIVNKSPFAMLYGIPVAVIGIAGYLLLGFLAGLRAYAWMLPLVTGAFAFAIHLADV